MVISTRVRTLTPGNYKFEFYYGDLLFDTIDIKIE